MQPVLDAWAAEKADFPNYDSGSDGPKATDELLTDDGGRAWRPDDSGGPDMFLHISALQSAGIDPDNIRKGDRLTFDVESTRDGKTKAGNVRQG